MTRVRNHRSAKAAGARFERQVADHLAEHVDDRIDRRVKTGSADKGDIGGLRLAGGGRVVVECKDTSVAQLAQWAKEVEAERINDAAVAGVVVHKRRGKGSPGEQWVTMTMADFVAVLTGRRA